MAPALLKTVAALRTPANRCERALEPSVSQSVSQSFGVRQKEIYLPNPPASYSHEIRLTLSPSRLTEMTRFGHSRCFTMYETLKRHRDSYFEGKKTKKSFRSDGRAADIRLGYGAFIEQSHAGWHTLSTESSSLRLRVSS